ncbi:hypothetical protein E2C01_092249 [Portunus trituberculatus]|uniref:Uncharacterized protein n=1 Tax=Portunus trituberculatus TaxID=210409 RepID=A0A5B7JQW3_PORTR|nr:hypothetical protein [Portunus trituberculatus]
MADRRQRVGASSTPRAAPCLRVVVVLVVMVVALLLHGRGRVVAFSARVSPSAWRVRWSVMSSSLALFTSTAAPGAVLAASRVLPGLLRPLPLLGGGWGGSRSGRGGSGRELRAWDGLWSAAVLCPAAPCDVGDFCSRRRKGSEKMDVL